jgi:hypothetical protein
LTILTLYSVNLFSAIRGIVVILPIVGHGAESSDIAAQQGRIARGEREANEVRPKPQGRL